MLKLANAPIRLVALTLIALVFSLLAGCDSSDSSADDSSAEIQGSENEQQGKSVLGMTTDNWISWRYFQSRSMFYFTHLQSWRCGLRSVSWGLERDDLNKDLPIADCDDANPNAVPTDISPYIFLDDISASSDGSGSEEQDSFIGLSDESSSDASPLIDRIFVQLEYFDGSKSEIREFRAPQSALGPE